MSLYNDYGTNKDSEKKGVWFEYGPNEDGTVPAFKLSRMGKGNKKYAKLIESRMKPHRQALKLGALSPELANEILMGVFIDSVLVDSRNIQDKEGNVVKLDKAAATKLFKDLPDLFDDLQSKAEDMTSFRDEEVEEDAKN